MKRTTVDGDIVFTGHTLRCPMCDQQTSAWAEGRITAADLRNSLKEEDKILLMSGPSSAIAHDRRVER